MNESLAGNRVQLHADGYVEVTLVGDQTNKTIADSARECERLTQVLKAQGKRVLGLIDFQLEGDFSTGANKATLEAMTRIDYEQAAMFGTSKLLAEVSNLIIKALGKEDRTKVFGTREAAVAWLVMRDPLKG